VIGPTGLQAMWPSHPTRKVSGANEDTKTGKVGSTTSTTTSTGPRLRPPGLAKRDAPKKLCESGAPMAKAPSSASTDAIDGGFALGTTAQLVVARAIDHALVRVGWRLKSVTETLLF
jgi:hypothetical protein